MITASLAEVDCEATLYGVKVARIGYDRDSVVAFTHDRRRAIAAAVRLYREDGDRPVEVTVDRTHWWQVVDNCGCGEKCACPTDDDGELLDHECAQLGLPPCADDFSWSGVDCAKDAPGALPVTIVDVRWWQ